MVGSYEDRGFSKEGRNARRKGKERLLTKQTETPFANKKKTGPKHMGSDTERGKIVSPGGQTKGNLRHDLAFTGDDSWDSDEESWSDQSESDTSDLPAAAGTEQTGKKSERKHLEQIKTRLGLTDKDFLNFERSKKSDTKGQTVSTAAGKPKKEPEVIVFEDPTARNRKVRRNIALPAHRYFETICYSISLFGVDSGYISPVSAHVMHLQPKRCLFAFF